MKNEIRYKSELHLLNQQTRQQIEQDIKQLSESLTAGLPARLRLGDDQEIALPVAAVELIREALTLERDGKSFLLLEEDAEVSPEKAAEMLRISRPTLLKKLDGGEIPFHYVGSHRRIAVADVLVTGRRRKSALRRRCGKCAMRRTRWASTNRETACPTL